MKLSKLFLASMLLFTITNSQFVFSQIAFQKIIGNALYNGNIPHEARGIQQTTDGGFIITGNTPSDTINSFNPSDIFLLKTSANGTPQWFKTYGDAKNDVGYSLVVAPDGGFTVAGISQDSNYTQKAFLMKADSLGDLQWSKSYGDSLGYSGSAYSVALNYAHNGYVISGMSPNPAAAVSVALFQTDLNGNLISSTGFGSADFWNLQEEGYDVCPTSDGNYLITGYSNSFNSDSLGFSHSDFYVIKTNGTNKMWSVSMGGAYEEMGYASTETSDGYIFVGKTNGSFGGTLDALVIKLDKNGVFQWAKRMDNGAYDDAQGVVTTQDDGILVSGRTQIIPGGLFIWKLDNAGNSQWIKVYNSAYDAFDDIPAKVKVTTDNGYVITGEGDYLPGTGSSTVYLIKTDNTGSTGCDITQTGTIADVSITVHIPNDSLVNLGYTTNTLSFNQNSWITLDSAFCITTRIPHSVIDNFQLTIAPNPFFEKATIFYSLPEDSSIEIDIYNVLGEKVKSLAKEKQSRGEHQLLFDGDGPNGIYFVKIKTNNEIFTKKIMQLK